VSAVVRVTRAAYPVPLRFVAFRDPGGGVVIVLALGLTRRQERDAVRDATGRARRTGWLGAAVPAVPAAHHAVRAHAAAIAAAAVTMALVPAVSPAAGPGGRVPSLPAPSASAAPPHARKGRRPPAAGKDSPPPSPPAGGPPGGDPSPGRPLLPGTPVRALLRGTLSPVTQLHARPGIQAPGVSAGVTVTPRPPALLPAACVSVPGITACVRRAA
jgi:hypothetical protein